MGLISVKHEDIFLQRDVKLPDLLRGVKPDIAKMVFAARHAGDAFFFCRVAEDKAVLPCVLFQPLLRAALVLFIADINSEPQLMLAAAGLLYFLVRPSLRFLKRKSVGHIILRHGV